MIMIGIDAHKRTHTAVAIDEVGRELAIRTVAATSSGHLALLRWAAEIAEDRSWAVEDCRHLSRHLERDLLGSGERILRVPPKMMANARDSGRTYVEMANPQDPASFYITKDLKDAFWWSERDGWGHIYRFDGNGVTSIATASDGDGGASFTTPDPKAQLTSGAWQVGQISYVDETAKQIYFTGRGRDGSVKARVKCLSREHLRASHGGPAAAGPRSRPRPLADPSGR